MIFSVATKAAGGAGLQPAAPGFEPGASGVTRCSLAGDAGLRSLAEGFSHCDGCSTFGVPGFKPGTAGCKPALPAPCLCVRVPLRLSNCIAPDENGPLSTITSPIPKTSGVIKT